MAYSGNTVHIACAFSIVELLAVLYRNHLRYPLNNPNAPDRDYLVLSKGHGVMAQYACMNELGWISDKELKQYFSNETRLKGLSDSRIDGLEVTSGSLGHGLSIGVGLALGAKRRQSQQKVFVIVGDGEMNEGAIWEACMFASHHQLSNLIVIIDANGYQAMGRTEDVLNLGSLELKLTSFGFITTTVDGHDQELINSAVQKLSLSTSSKPRALIANTVKGKGVRFMESDNTWHYTRLTAQTYQEALQSINSEKF